MTDKEKIRNEIERRKKEYCNGLDCVAELYDSLLSFIDSLQEESVSEDLEKFAEEWDESLYRSDAVIAGAKWQLSKLMQNAIEREVKVDAGGYPYIDDTELYDYDNEKPLAKAGDKIKIIFLKE